MKHRLVAGALFLALASATGAQAAPKSNVGGAAGLVAAVVQIAADNLVNVQVIDSFNNIDILNNVLNNSPILSNNDVDITIGDVSILNNVQVGVLQNFLNNNNITLDDVVAIGLLDTGDIIVFV